MSFLGMEASTVQINIVCFELNVQKKTTSIECKSSTGFLNLRVTDMGRHDRYDY